MASKGWIGFDLDGTLAKYDAQGDHSVIGEPIKPMVMAALEFIARGYTVKIVTARVYFPIPFMATPEEKHRLDQVYLEREAIAKWCMGVFGRHLEVTCSKDYEMIALFDDRAIQVRTNTGVIMGDALAVLGHLV